MLTILLLGAAGAAFASERNLLISRSSSFKPQLDCVRPIGAFGRPLHYLWQFDLASCMDVSLWDNGGSIVQIENHMDLKPPRALVWLQESGVSSELRREMNIPPFDESVRNIHQRMAEELASYLEDQRRPASSQVLRMNNHLGSSVISVDDSAVFEALPSRVGMEFLWRSPNNTLVSVDMRTLIRLDQFLDPHVVPIVINNLIASTVTNDNVSPSITSSFASAKPVPDQAIARLQAVLHSLKFSPDIASVLSTLSVSEMLKDIQHLTGEDAPDGDGIWSRHSFSSGARQAADWIQAQMESYGADCRQESFLTGFAPNVICAFPYSGKVDELTLLSAHYDSRGSFGSTRAPGGNDDGSGVTHLLAIARAIHKHGIKFRAPVEIVAFAGEEQGLLGSNAYARQLSEEGRDITIMIQADMLAYHSPSEPPQLGQPDSIGLAEAAYLVGNISKIYAPELSIGPTPACCSDHQSFWQYGFASTQVYERAGPIIDPMYHNSGDLSDREGYDLHQVRSIAKVTFATLLMAAGFDI